MSTTDDSREARAGGKRERTRAALVAATLELVNEKGFAAASLDEIASRAGMTKGAIYSNFGSKAELLLAAMQAKGLSLASARPPATTIVEELAAMADDLVAALGRAKGEAGFLAEFQLAALADPELRQGLAATYGDSFSRTAAYLAELKGATMPPRDLAVALQALALGFMVQSFLTPDEIETRVVRETLRALGRGLGSKL